MIDWWKINGNYISYIHNNVIDCTRVLPGDSLARCWDMAPSLYSLINSSIVLDWEEEGERDRMGV